MAADWGAGGLLHWLRDHNRASVHPLRFAGIDLPEAGGALRPVLEPLADHLRDVDPDSLPLVDTALRISDSFLAGLGSGAAAGPAWSQLDSAEQDALTASLARLQLRLHAIEPLAADRHRHEIAERMMAAARTVDYMFRAMHGLISGTGITADLSARDSYLAETLRRHLEHSARDTRTALPMGQYLARTLGEDCVGIAATHTAGHVPQMHPDSAAAVGFTIADADLPAPAPGSIEAGLIDAGLARRVRRRHLHADGDQGSHRDVLTFLAVGCRYGRWPFVVVQGGRYLP